MTQMLRYDLLASVRYQTVAINAVKKGSAIAVLDRTFLKSVKAHNQYYRKILTSNKDLTLVVHGIWSSNHSFHDGQAKDVIVVARRLNRIATELGAHDRVWFSPFLEQRMPFDFMNPVIKKIHKKFPSLKLINSYIEGGTHTIPKTVPEVHNFLNPKNKECYVWSFDGEDSTKESVAKYKKLHANAIMFGLWHHKFNGKTDLHDKTSPLMRSNFPKASEIRAIGDLY